IYSATWTEQARLQFRASTSWKDVYSIFNVLDKRLHRIKRRIIGEGISERSMRRFEPTMIKEIDIFLKQLAEVHKSKAATNMTERCKRLGMDIIGQLGFGTSLELQTDSKNRFTIKGMAGGNYRNNVYIQFPMAKYLGIEVLLYPFFYAIRMRYYFLLKRLVAGRLAEGKHARADLFSFVVGAKDPESGERIRMSELWSEATFFFPAGGDTTSTALSAIEIRSAFTAGAEICIGPKVSSCSYLRACIDETLRMSPPVTGTLWRELPPGSDNEPLIIDGHSIPKGTLVGVNIYSIHHNELYFPDSFTFKPERWLSDNARDAEEAPAERKAMLSAFSPFSIGSRACAGKTMAYMELSIVMAKTLWYFDFHTPEGKSSQAGAGIGGKTNGRGRPAEFQLYDIFSSTHTGPNLRFLPRDEQWKELIPMD
ncbi:MAG: hypothetical protein Q9157_006684, partial [Trypethelium eluteriae]